MSPGGGGEGVGEGSWIRFCLQAYEGCFHL